MDIQALANQLLPHFLAPSSGLMAALQSACFNWGLGPRSLARIYAAKRNRWAPAFNTMTSLAGLAAGATSSAVLLTSDPIARSMTLTALTLDAGTSYNDVAISILVGGSTSDADQETFIGPQLNPATNNGCLASACTVPFCVGDRESAWVTVTNTSSVALGANAAFRAQFNLAFLGDPGFVNCWLQACIAGKVPIPPELAIALRGVPGGQALLDANGAACGACKVVV